MIHVYGQNQVWCLPAAPHAGDVLELAGGERERWPFMQRSTENFRRMLNDAARCMLNDAAALNDAAFCMHAERRRCARRNLNNVVALRMLNDDAALHT